MKADVLEVGGQQHCSTVLLFSFQRLQHAAVRGGEAAHAYAHAAA